MPLSKLIQEVKPQEQKTVSCFHCGQPCDDNQFQVEEKNFCCYGCKTVFEILNENNLCEYYDYQNSPGIRVDQNSESYAYLDEPDVREKLIQFEIDGLSRVQFYIPAIHCISCIWLLENLKRLNSGIIRSEVNFARKILVVDFNINKISLGGVADLIGSTGYKPVINLESSSDKKKSPYNKKLIIQLAVAGFCFGNIMLLSFPEYLGIDRLDEQLQKVFSYLNVVLALPVLLYSADGYLISAWKSIKQKQVNLDVPIALGILVLFIRSASDILLQTGPGYMDSLAGLVFFLLIGRWFQDKTYENLAFDRDFRSYFPLAVYKRTNQEWKATLVHKLRKGDHIRIRNKEIIPADSILVSDATRIDYSFVTGESNPVNVVSGALVYAGGRVIGQPVVLSIKKDISQSHLTSLWNNEIFDKPKRKSYKSLMDNVAKIFTWSVLGLALATGLFWFYHDSSRVWLIVTAVLMVACPCALALAAPFTFGSMLRVFGNHGLYLKNTGVIEDMAMVNAIVFDKTGTITYGSHHVNWNGRITKDELAMVRSVAISSTHPLSSLLASKIDATEDLSIASITEIVGQGIEGTVNNHVIKLGSAKFVNQNIPTGKADFSSVHVSIDGDYKGYFEISTSLREGIAELVKNLGSKVKSLLSGDSQADESRMKTIFGSSVHLGFNQSPQQKMDFVHQLQESGDKVMMIGDGLNDSGALKQSNVGIAVSDDAGVFTPACDGILSGSSFAKLDKFMSMATTAMVILKVGLAISLLYNVVGLSFAVSGYLTPLVAAILMPISSISVVVFSTFMVNVTSKRIMT